MTDGPDELEEMRLCGYVQLAPNGFALPAYASGPGANAWYVAVPTIEGDHQSVIERFELLEDENVIPVPDPSITVSAGDPWQDVFLWDGRVYTGTPAQILDAVTAFKEDLRALAPLSYFDLAVAVESPLSPDLAKGALAFLEQRLGDAHGAASFRELVLRPGVLIELQRQYRKLGAKPLPDILRDFTLREQIRGQFEVEMAPGTLVSIGGEPAAAELRDSIARFGDVIGLPIRAEGLGSSDPPVETTESIPPHPRYETVGRRPLISPFPNILVIAGDPRAEQISRFLDPPMQVAFGSRSVWSDGGYRLVRGNNSEGIQPNDSVLMIKDRLSADVPFELFAVVVCLAGNDVIENARFEDDVRAARSIKPDIPFLLAPTPPADRPSALDTSKRFQEFDAIIDTTLARSPFWTGQPRRSVDRRMADIVGAVSTVMAIDDRLRDATIALRGSKQPHTLSFIGGPGRFNVGQATVSELNAAGLDRDQSGVDATTRVGFEMRERSSKRIHNAVIELQPLRPDYEHFARAAVGLALGNGFSWPEMYSATSAFPDAVRRSLEYPQLAVPLLLPGTNETVVVTAETPDLTALREADNWRVGIARYTDVETLRNLADRDRPRSLPSEIRLPPLYRYPGNRGLATRGVDTRDVIRLPEAQWKLMLSEYPSSELARETRRYCAAIDTRGIDPEIALPIPAVWNALNEGDLLARELLDRFPRVRDAESLSGKRIGDLITAWSHPSRGASRWVLEDGRVPVELTELEPGYVPAQRLFLIDGDSSVPTFLQSRLFAVWAKALLPTSTSWAPRFQVSKTFDAFPFPWVFAVSPPESGSPPQLRFSQQGEALRIFEMVGERAQGLAEIVNEYGSDEYGMRQHPLIRRIDELLLQAISLPSDATDLDILERLIELNLARS